MRQNPFHDWHHVLYASLMCAATIFAEALTFVCSDVTQFCFTMLKTTGLSEVLAAESIIGIFLAAIAHDLDHRQVNVYPRVQF
jgi:hypothetical protein